MILVGPTGCTIRGTVLDSAVAPLEQKLREYDRQLYFRWNPKKLKGWGCWEVRRKPNEKTVKEVLSYGGNTYVVVDYIENNFDNHIMDVAYLNYDILTKLKRMDTWAVSDHGKDFATEMDRRERDYKEKTEEQAKAERRYNIAQHKSMVRDLMDYTLSGGDPSKIANYWPKG